MTNILLNWLGFVVTISGAVIVLRAFSRWQGILREGILFFLISFFLFSLGFLWSAIYAAGTPAHDGDIAFFAAGAVFALLGSRKIFSFTKSQ